MGSQKTCVPSVATPSTPAGDLSSESSDCEEDSSDGSDISDADESECEEPEPKEVHEVVKEAEVVREEGNRHILVCGPKALKRKRNVHWKEDLCEYEGANDASVIDEKEETVSKFQSE